MRALLDTHVVLWFAMGDTRLPIRYRKLLHERNGDLYFSAVSAAEIAIKFMRGTLRLPGPPLELIPFLISDLNLQPLALTPMQGLLVIRQPRYHADPFDRLLVAQAIQEDMPIISRDAHITQYDVKVVW